MNGECPACDKAMRGDICDWCGWTRPKTRTERRVLSDRARAALAEARAKLKAKETK